MGRKSKYSYEIKIEAVQAYERGEGGIWTIAERFNITKGAFERWWLIYQSQGAAGLKVSHNNRQWSKEIKISAVNEYLSGLGSLRDICIKYNISTHSILSEWIKVYNSGHKELKTTGLGGRIPMTKGRKTTFDERVQITQYCIANGRNYGVAMDKYKVSYQQIYLWVRKYDKNGIDGLLERRGKAKPERELTEADRLRAQIKMIQAKNVELEMENRLLKKLQEVERRRH